MKLETAYQKALRAVSECANQVTLAESADQAQAWADAARTTSLVLCDLDLMVRAQSNA